MSEQEIEDLKNELKFYRSIDFVSMGRFIELEKSCDLTGWEFLADAWRNENQAKALWYVQQRWNKEFHYNAIFDKKEDTENDSFRSLLFNHAHLFQMYQNTENELDEANEKLVNQKNTFDCKVNKILESLGNLEDAFTNNENFKNLKKDIEDLKYN